MNPPALPPTPDAITRSWRGSHDLYCSTCGHVALVTGDLHYARRQLDALWANHLATRHGMPVLQSKPATDKP